MLVKINNKFKIVKDNPFLDSIDFKIKLNVSKYWNEFIKEKKNYFDGDIISVYKYDEYNRIIYLRKNKYSELIYSKHHDDLDVRSFFVSVLFKTNDNYYVVIKNNNDKTNIIGGIVDEEDLDVDIYDSKITLKREVLEELNIDIDNEKQVLNYEKRFLKTPNPGRNYGIVYYGYLNMTKDELNKYFIDNRNKFDGEVKELLLLSREEVLNLDLTDNDISYLKEMIEEE